MVLRITVNGKTQSIAAHCRDFNKKYGTVCSRINKYKWSIEQALGLLPPPSRKWKHRKPIINRIYEKIICDIKTRCWNWTGAFTYWGYGVISINNKVYRVHRIIYKEIYGLIPEDKPCILHRCDNPKCCNPLHLYAGTHQDNMNDKIKRNRLNPNPIYGKKHHFAKLTEKQVLEIRTSKEPQVIMAKRFKVSQAAISAIKTRKNWKHI